MKDTILFVNAGHGGLDDNGKYTTPGNIGKKTLHTNGKNYHCGGWFYEGVFNRDIAEEFIIEAQKRGYICERTYHKSIDTSRKSRIDAANAKAAGKKTIWISFHANAISNTTSPQLTAEGVAVLVYQNGTETAKNAEKICNAMQTVFDLWNSKRRAKLVWDKSDRALDETQNTNMPAMLFEVGFFDNPHNADLIIDPKFRKRLVVAMISEIEKIYS